MPCSDDDDFDPVALAEQAVADGQPERALEICDEYGIDPIELENWLG